MARLPSRRDALRAIAGLASLPFAGCTPRGSDGRAVASLWFSCGDKARKVLLELVRGFNECQGRYRVEAVYQGDYFEALAKLRTAISARAAPTLSHVVAEVVPYLASAGVLESLERFEGARELDLVPQLEQAGAYLGGGERPLVALPFNRSTPIAYYNKRVFAEAGLGPPRTWDELRSTARALTTSRTRLDTRYGFECPIDWWFWAALVGQAGGEVMSRQGEPTLGGEAGVQALELWQSLVEQGHMKPPPGRDYNAWEVTNTDFMAGNVAMIWTSTAFLRYLEDNSPFEVGAAPLPRGVRSAVPTGGTFFVMPRGAPPAEQEAGWAFLRHMMRPAQANAWATRTGYMPVSRGGLAALESAGYYEKHPNDRVAIDQLANAAPWPWAPELFRVQREAVQPRLEEAVLMKRDARAVLAEARRAAESP